MTVESRVYVVGIEENEMIFGLGVLVWGSEMIPLDTSFSIPYLYALHVRGVPAIHISRFCLPYKILRVLLLDCSWQWNRRVSEEVVEGQRYAVSIFRLP